MSTPSGPSPFAFVAAELDRRAHWRAQDDTLDQAWAANGGIVVLRPDGRVLCRVDEAGLLLLSREHVETSREQSNFLGVREETSLFAVVIDEDRGGALAERHGGRFLDLRAAASELSASEAVIAAYARALAHWQSRKRFCGRCGAPTRFLSAGHRAVCTDAACAQEYFPRTDPAIIVLVTDGRRCLLGTQPGWPAKRYSTLAGFVEPGETLEQAVAREVAEESGVRVAASQYVASQPWPFPASLMLGFEAQAADPTITVGEELADARWFDADAMHAQIDAGELALPPPLSISYHLIARWCERLTGRAPTPGPMIRGR